MPYAPESIRPVSSFAPQGSEADKLLAYPFERPQGSFLTDGMQVQVLPGDFTSFQEVANEHLHKNGLPPLEERIPLVMYGSNANPTHYAAKMNKYAVEPGSESLMATVPVVMAQLIDNQVVWHGKPAQRGSVFAELYASPGEAAFSHVAFLTPEQLVAMHTTEGITYRMQQMEVGAGVDARALKAAVYVANRSCVLLHDGQPVPVRRQGEAGAEGSMTAREAVAYMLQGNTEYTDPEELVAAMAAVPLAERKRIQEDIRQQLAAQGKSADFSYGSPAGADIGRADFNSLPFYGEAHLTAAGPQPVQLLEQVARPLWSAQSGDSGAKDPVRIIRDRAHHELEVRLTQSRV